MFFGDSRDMFWANAMLHSQIEVVVDVVVVEHDWLDATHEYFLSLCLFLSFFLSFSKSEPRSVFLKQDIGQGGAGALESVL